ncbi:hypothetical protein Pth03_20450 [Planotetraspora thailandica]|uniref:Uncharacterized protein n=1 Tax=Planotetraspora thailandica TaxID=487172 RepID=A0A8J3V272_9ACTN|nr:hypothetical protein [Planotetraspora thailandica]GII53656.1 hypothetical protein Pth03_20450 [Planotetraspora thailandica]
MGKLWLVALLLMVVACGETTPGPSGSSAQPSRPVSGHPSSGGSAEPGATPSQATPVGNTIDPHKTKWLSAEPTDGGKALLLTWWSGVEPCTALDRVDVSESADQVTVTIWEGKDRRHPDAVCIAIAIKKQTKVNLSTPLGNRKVIDGAKH